MMSVALRLALTESTEPGLRPLPDPVAALLAEVGAPPRLAAHLRAVHDVAGQLTAAISARWPGLEFDHHAVLFGAATHDIGKTLHPDELSGPGSAHEHTGYELLLAHGVDQAMARFARNHGSPTAPGLDIETLLVIAADKIWKAKHVPALEDRLIDYLCAVGGGDRWEVFMGLDDIMDRIAAGADDRLAFQARHPIHA
jgi:hypothetical protein